MGQLALHLGERRQVETPAAELLGNGGGQVADLAQDREIVVEVGVGLVRALGAGPELGEDRFVGKRPTGRCAVFDQRHDSSP